MRAKILLISLLFISLLLTTASGWYSNYDYKRTIDNSTSDLLLPVNGTNNATLVNSDNWVYAIPSGDLYYNSDTDVINANNATELCLEQVEPTMRVSCPNPPNNLVSHWSFDDDSATDLIGGNNGSISGATTGVSGKFHCAYDFDGSTDYVDMGDVCGYSSSSPFSISFWYYNHGLSGDNKRILGRSTADDDYGFLFDNFIDSDGNLVFRSNKSNYQYSVSPTANTNEWIHIIMVNNGDGTQDHYVNGIYDGSSSLSWGGGTANNFQVGSTGAATGEYFDGIVDEIYIYNKALTSTEVSQLVNDSRFTTLSTNTTPPTYSYEIDIINETVSAENFYNGTDVTIDEGSYNYSDSFTLRDGMVIESDFRTDDDGFGAISSNYEIRLYQDDNNYITMGFDTNEMSEDRYGMFSYYAGVRTDLLETSENVDYSDYHTHKMVYDNSSREFDYYIDGTYKGSVGIDAGVSVGDDFKVQAYESGAGNLDIHYVYGDNCEEVNLTGKDKLTRNRISNITVTYNNGADEKTGSHVLLNYTNLSDNYITINADGYESRQRYIAPNTCYGNLTTYLLDSGNSTDITFHVIAGNTDVVGANITIQKRIDGTYQTLSKKLTDSIGRASFPLKFFDTYRVSISTTSYGSKTLDIEVSEYTITIQMTYDKTVIEYDTTHVATMTVFRANNSPFNSCPVTITNLDQNETYYKTTDDNGQISMKVNKEHKYNLLVNYGDRNITTYLQYKNYYIPVNYTKQTANESYGNYSVTNGTQEWDVLKIAEDFGGQSSPAAQGLVASVILFISMVGVSTNQRLAVGVGIIITIILAAISEFSGIHMLGWFPALICILFVIGMYVIKEKW